MQAQLISGRDVADLFKKNNVPVIAVREGSIDVESEVQVTNRMSVTVCCLDGSSSIFELLNDDPDNTNVRIGRRIQTPTELLKAIREKLDEEKRGRRSK